MTDIAHSFPILPSLNEAKAYARSLRRDMAEHGERITHARALEITAHRLGFVSWNVLAARLGPRKTFSPQLGDKVRGLYLKMPFFGTIIAISEQAGGARYAATINFDAPVNVSRFSSFNVMRRRVNVNLDGRGMTKQRTSDGEPHMIILETISDCV